MWVFEMNRCVTCMKKGTCPDRVVIQKACRNILDTLEGSEGGSNGGNIIIACHDGAAQ